jgi:PhnB protein
MKLPEGYQTVMPYLLLNDTNGFLDFTVKVFNATIKENHVGGDGKTMHGEVLIGGSCIMLGPAGDRFPQQNAGLFVYVDNADEGYKIALENGATSVMGLSDQPYGRTCGVKDPFGNTWWITSIK